MAFGTVRGIESRLCSMSQHGQTGEKEALELVPTSFVSSSEQYV